MKYIFLIFLLAIFSSCMSFFHSLLLKDEKLRKQADDAYFERRKMEKVKDNQKEIENQIESDKDFFIQNCYSIDSLEAREEC